jgi:cell wall-associated NlpC family hydrolase
MKCIALLSTLLLLNTTVQATETRSPDVIQEIPLYALSLIGTPYKYGGSHPESGMDCSGFVSHVYGQVAGIQLPRSSQEISQHGTALEPVDLQPGDLVFFNTLSRAFSHVGVYLGENRFIHASSSQTGAVMVSDMNQPYWSKRFDGARRLLIPPDKEVIPQP